MTIEVRVPQLPESVADATLVAWRKQPGDTVQRDENLVDLETDKVVLEVPAPASGVLQEIRVQNGATVTSGQILAVLAPGEAAKATTGKTDGWSVVDGGIHLDHQFGQRMQPGEMRVVHYQIEKLKRIAGQPEVFSFKFDQRFV